jgi:hypothetical protein
MSKGAGRVERAIRTMIERRGRGWQQWFTPDDIAEAAFGMKPWTEAQRHSAMRAMHRIVDGQPGWSVEKHRDWRMAFRFTPPPDAPKAERAAAGYLLDRPKALRQQAHEAAEQRRLRRERRAQAKQPLPLSYFWTCGQDTLGAFPAGLMGLPVGRKVTTIPGTEPATPRRRMEGVTEDMAREARNNVWAALAARAHDHGLEAEPGDLAMAILDMELAYIEKAATYREIHRHMGDAETIRAMYLHIRAVRQRAEVVVLIGHRHLGRQLIWQEEATARAEMAAVSSQNEAA